MSDLLSSVHAIPAGEWDSLAQGSGPASCQGWFAALEAALPREGEDRWTPAHLHGDDVLIPLFEREGSRGEFVWDDPIAESCEANGIPYGPRAVGVIPWTPIAGPRVLTASDDGRAAALHLAPARLRHAAEARGWTGIHLQFCQEDEAAAFVQAGWIERLTWQYIWRRPLDGGGPFSSLPGKRRRELGREMRAFEAQGLRLQVVAGPEAPDELWDAMPDLYARTAERHGDVAPLGPLFFSTVRATMARDVVFFAAYRGDDLVAATFQLRSDGGLFGRIWGTREALPFLHFNLAYHFPIRWAWEQGLDRFEPGHGGEYKRRRACDPVLCRSVHLFAHRGLHRSVASWARREAGWVREQLLRPKAP